ncbi:MAG: 50S ribosomal protein L4 [Patescibacteria group bacterium]
MKVDIFDKDNKKVEILTLPERIFGAKWNAELVKQAFDIQTSNKHHPWAHTKNRSEVRGGGKKPWAQKHTGRSRHSSIRSPLWSGGGVTFGPRKDRDYTKKISKKMKQAALFSLLSRKLKEDDFKIIDSLKIENPKTKTAAAIFKKLFKASPSVIIIPAKNNRNMKLAARNIPKFKVLSSNSMNVADSLNHKKILFEKEAILEFIGQYEK